MKIELTDHEAKELSRLASSEAQDSLSEIACASHATLANLDEANFWGALACKLSGVQFSEFTQSDFPEVCWGCL